MIEDPVTVTYEKPTERVLFNVARDANVFFHLYEAMWMLAGRNDVAPLAYYNSKIAEIASDDGKTFNGGYGHRWRKAATWEFESEPYGDRELGDWKMGETDQLDLIVKHLKENPNSRRVVLQMWNVEDDLLKIDDRWTPSASSSGCDKPNCAQIECSVHGPAHKASKDVCCNTAAYFSIRASLCERCKGTGHEPYDNPHTGVREYGQNALCQNCDDCLGNNSRCYLDMTVTNRSNDMIWGMLGANVVHFSFLLEYLAGRIGVEVGRYHQFTNNLHVYTERWEPEKWLADSTPNYYTSTMSGTKETVKTVPLGANEPRFEADLRAFVEANYSEPGEGLRPMKFVRRHWSSTFLDTVAQPMCDAYHFYKLKDFQGAMSRLSEVAADDWRIAGQNWMNIRYQKAAMKAASRA